MQQIPLTPAANQFLSQLMARGNEDAPHIVEKALERALEEDKRFTSPQYVAWIQGECKEALEEIERGGGVDYDMDEILREADTEFENGQMELNPSVFPQS